MGRGRSIRLLRGVLCSVWGVIELIADGRVCMVVGSNAGPPLRVRRSSGVRVTCGKTLSGKCVGFVGAECLGCGLRCLEVSGLWVVLATHPPMSRVPIMYGPSVTSMRGDCRCSESEGWLGRVDWLVLIVA